MKLIACSFLLLVILEESYCKTTSSVNKTSTSWGYDYSLSDTRGFKVKHDDRGYQVDPFYDSTSSDLKKHYNSFSVYDQVTSPGATTDSQPHSSTNDVIDVTSNGTTNSHPPYKTPISSYSLPVGDMNRSAIVPSNGPLYKTSFRAPYGSQNTPMYAAPTGPLYYPQAPSYGPQMGPMYGPPTGGTYGPTGPIYTPQNGQMFWPPNGQMYVPQNRQTNGYPTGSLYGLHRNY